MLKSSNGKCLILRLNRKDCQFYCGRCSKILNTGCLPKHCFWAVWSVFFIVCYSDTHFYTMKIYLFSHQAVYIIKSDTTPFFDKTVLMQCWYCTHIQPEIEIHEQLNLNSGYIVFKKQCRSRAQGTKIPLFRL